jgi:hypothetical protein
MRTLKTQPTAQNDVPRLGADIQAILMVLSRRESKYDKGPMDLRNTCLSETNLREADFSGTNLSGADLRGTNLSGVNLFGANLREADLRRAYWLTQPQINSALGDAKTQLPDTLKKPSDDIVPRCAFSI